jgi:hypothetical protein
LINKIDVKQLLGPDMKRCLVSENKTKKQMISKVSHMPISTIGVGHLFGVEDVMQDRNYSVTVKCTSSTGVLYRIPTSDFM